MYYLFSDAFDYIMEIHNTIIKNYLKNLIKILKYNINILSAIKLKIFKRFFKYL